MHLMTAINENRNKNDKQDVLKEEEEDKGETFRIKTRGMKGRKKKKSLEMMKE